MRISRSPSRAPPCVASAVARLFSCRCWFVKIPLYAYPEDTGGTTYEGVLPTVRVPVPAIGRCMMNDVPLVGTSDALSPMEASNASNAKILVTRLSNGDGCRITRTSTRTRLVNRLGRAYKSLHSVEVVLANQYIVWASSSKSHPGLRCSLRGFALFEKREEALFQ